MKSRKILKYFRWQTGVLAGGGGAIVSLFVFYLSFPPYLHTHDLTCRANLSIVREGVTFRGVVDIKSAEKKGIVNVNGVVIKDEQTYVVQRTVLFTRMDYGISPVWTSRMIIPSNGETVSASLLNQILPQFYIEYSNITDVDIFPINNTAYMITKEGYPYLYCQKYTLTDKR
ncbi:hypothetical protein DPY73_13955 [Salmonella enterica subsp. enterica]|nr:hypothetical protein [Salmonella enterica subsp. enterica serovar Braenderup]